MTTRLPTKTRARIAPLARLPLFHGLAGRFVVIAGHGEGALWKAELLSAAGAEVRVFAGKDAPLGEDFARLAASPIAGPIALNARAWAAEDLAGAALAIGEFASDAEAEPFAAAARAVGIPVNCVDRPALCDFQFGSIVNRSPMVIGISTDGAAPIFAQSVRARIESLVPAGFARWAAAARDWRPAIMGANREARRSFWERFTRAAWDTPDAVPGEDLRDTLLAAESPQGGSVTLVGAGPGDPELLTLKALRALQSASVILYDDLVGQPILDLARREAQRIAVGKRGGLASCKQDDINARMVALAREGHRVVRLKGGDPLVFGRANEEIDACRAAGIAVSIVPGITAAQGAAAALGFSLTHREVARRLQLITGHAADGTLPQDIDWHAVADPATTTAIYMGRATIAPFLARAFAAGLDPATPALAVASATLPEQAEVRASAAALPGAMASLPRGPVLVILGRVTGELREQALRAVG